MLIVELVWHNKVMTTLAHILSGSYIALYSAGVDPGQTHYVVAAIIAAGILDLDHIFPLIRDRALYKKHGYAGQLHKARGMVHELPGFALIGIFVLAYSFIDVTMAYVIGVSFLVHLVQDVIMGISMPFSPIDKTEIHLLPQEKHFKIIVDIATLLIFGFLWTQYLNVHI